MVLGAKFAPACRCQRDRAARYPIRKAAVARTVDRPVVRVVNGPSIALRDNLLAVAASRAIA